MRVALVCPYDLGRFGGVQDQVTKLAGWLSDAGHETVIVGPGETGPPGARLVGPVTVLPANGAATPVTIDPRAWRRVVDAVADADVVHVHEPLMPLVSMAALRGATAPVVATFHADPPRAVRRIYRVGRRVVRAALRPAAVVTAVSPVAAAPLVGITVPRLVPNGVDVELIRGVRGGPKAPAAVVFVGRADRRKGLDVLLEAWPEVTRRVPPATLVVIGAASPVPPPVGVTFLGRVTDAEKYRRLAGAAALVAPNRGGESFGIVLAEAMAAGCAVVASALPGFVHVAGDAARFVAPGDPEALGDALCGLITDREALAELQERGRRRASRFDRSVVVDGYVAAYRDALEP